MVRRVTVLACLVAFSVGSDVHGATNRVVDGLVAAYDFSAGSGVVIADRSGVGEPLDLVIEDPDAVTWLPQGGVCLDAPTLIASEGPATKISAAAISNNTITLEAWVKPRDDTQTGPGRILTISRSGLDRNVVLGQQLDRYVGLMRTSGTGGGGAGYPSAAATALPVLTHVVLTHDDAENLRVYVGGQFSGGGPVQGDLSVWDRDHRLGIGSDLNETFPWLGEIHRAAVYRRALSAAEILQNFQYGPRDDGASISRDPVNTVVTEPSPAIFAVQAHGAETLSYQWFRDGLPLGEATNANLVIPSTDADVDNGASYRVVVSNAENVVTSQTAILVVNTATPEPPTIVSDPQNVIVEEPRGAFFWVLASGAEPLTYQWRRQGVSISGATEPWYSVVSTVASNDHDAWFDVVVSNDYGSVTSDVAVLTVESRVPAPPTIELQPSSATVTEGDDAAFRVIASGDKPLTYRWQRNGSDIAGANDAVYTAESVMATADDGALFRVLVSNALGVVTSDVAELTVEPYVPTPPFVATEPSDATVDEPQPVLFSVVAGGDPPLSYQWRRDGTNVPNAVSATYGLHSTSPADDGALFSVIITSPYGTATSRTARLTVVPDLPDPASIVRQPQDATVAESQPVAFIVQASGDAPLHYQWRRDNVPLAGATNSVYYLDETLLDLDNGALFSVVVSNAYGGVVSRNALLTVREPPGTEPPTIQVDPQDAIVTEPTAAAFTVSAAGASPLSYQWRRNGVPIPGAVASFYVLDETSAASDDDVLFDVVVSNEWGVAASDAAHLTVNAPPPPPPPEIVVQPADTVVQEPGPAAFTVVASGTPPLTRQWYRDGAPLAGATGASLVLASTVAADDGAGFQVVVTDAAGVVTSRVATLTVVPIPRAEGDIAGTITYGGAETGAVVVAAYTNRLMNHAPVATVTLDAPGAYILRDVAAGIYYVAAAMLLDPEPDTDHIGLTDPWAAYLTTSNMVGVTVSSDVTRQGIDMTLVPGSAANPNPFSRRSTRLDFDGDGQSDIGIYRPSEVTWYVFQSTDGPMPKFRFGTRGDIPVPADYDGDGRADLAVFRPSTVTWYVFGSSDGPRPPFRFGAVGDQPVPADYDGDGVADLAIYRPSTMTWYVFGSADGPLPPFVFGAIGDVPVPADYDGDGRADLAIFRPSTVTWYVFGSSVGPMPSFRFGTIGDLPAPGDFDGDGIVDKAIFRPSTVTWYVFGSSAGPMAPFRFGTFGDLPIR